MDTNMPPWTLKTDSVPVGNKNGGPYSHFPIRLPLNMVLTVMPPDAGPMVI